MSARRATIVAGALVIVLIACGLWYSSRLEAVARRTTGHIRTALARSALPRGAPPLAPHTLGQLQHFYEKRGHRPAWTVGWGSTSQARDLIEVLARADEEGLRPADYSAPELTRRLASYPRGPRLLTTDDPRQLADFDLLSTMAALRYASDVHDGRLSTKTRRDDLDDVLQNALTRGRVKETLIDLAPPHPGYEHLKQARARYAETLAGRGSSNLPVETRLRQIDLNMERWRSLPRSLGDRYLLVNVPEFMLHVYERERHVLAMRVVVGMVSKPTPVFSSAMGAVVVNPVWNVPESIVNEELLTKIADDPDHLARNGFRVFAGPARQGTEIDASHIDWRRASENPTYYTFRQDPGERNALGRLKFVLPNPFDVYLHDTPASRVFRRADRSLSHGCVRVEDPVRLASYVLQGRAEADPEALTQLITSGETRNLTLPAPLPVHIVYFTAFVDEEGELQFRNDVYGIDRELLAKLGR